MNTPLFAGFEGAKLHWNEHDTLIQTRHVSADNMFRNYQNARNRGAIGFRDTLPERFNIEWRLADARFAVGLKPIIVWSAIHFDQPKDPFGHVEQIASRLGQSSRLIAFNEPSVGYNISGYHKKDAIELALGMMETATNVNSALRFWTCDPTHNTSSETWQATDELVSHFEREIETVGLNYHACWAQEPLRDIIRCAAGRYPNHRIAITETSWHEGHPSDFVPHISNRREWWNHVMQEVAESGVELAAVTWAPWLDMSWEPGPAWPNGWPG